MSLIKYIIRRIIVMIPVLFGVLTLTFILNRLMPGDPVAARLAAAGLHNPAQGLYHRMRCQLGLCDPILIQYFRYLGELFTGNWGVSVSITRNQPVWDLVMERMPLTIDLTLISMLIATFLGIRAGLISAIHRNKTPDTIVRGLALIGVSLPVFFLGMLLQYYLGYVIPIFEPTGYLSITNQDPPYVTGFTIIDSFISGEWYLIVDYIWHLCLPIFCLSFIMLASITRQTRSSMLEVLEQDFIRTARAKGCLEKKVTHSHALRNALIPTVTIIGMNTAGLLGGAVLTETTFGLNGMGKLFVDALILSDYWVLSALVFLFTIIFVIANLFTDVIYAILDPRIRYT
ncbi:MAG: ABC transporter permease [Promethearchaeota archaeon]